MMHLLRTLRPALPVIALASFAAGPAGAQELYTLSAVTFSDGAVATGDFTYNPQSSTVDPFDITTTNGVTDTLGGYRYDPNTVSGTDFYGSYFQFSTGDPYHGIEWPGLALVINAPFDQYYAPPGVYSLVPGYYVAGIGPAASFEFTLDGDSRLIESGSLVVTAVPEASATVSFALLLALGGLVIVAKRKKVRMAD